MMVWPRVVPYPVVDLRVWVSGTLGTKFPDRPLGAMFVIEKFDKGIRRVAVGALRIG